MDSQLWMAFACIFLLLISLNLSSAQTSQTESLRNDDSSSTISSSTVVTDIVPPIVSGSGEAGGRKIPIYLGAFFTLGGGWDGSGIVPAVDMALEHINNNPNLLADYELRMVWNDTQCEAGLGTRVLFDQLFHEPQKIMILGPACSTATQAVAETAYYWNLVTMSYASASSALSNRNKYPYFYRTYMPDAMYNPARIRLMKDFGWTRVATIHENHELFSLAIDNLLTMLKNANITIIVSESFAENPRNQVENLRNQDARIIVGNMYEDKARRVFCEAYKLGMTGEGYVWFLIGWYKDKWWMDEDPTLDCTLEQMREAVEGSLYISTESLQLSPSPVPGVSGLTAESYLEAVKERLKWPQYETYTFNSLGPYGYDATWAVALMLNRSVEILKTKTFRDGSRRRLEDFTYDDDEMALLFFTLLNDTDFDGLTGPVSFRGGDRVGITQIEQLRPQCPYGEQHLSGSLCVTFEEVAADWESARNSCRASGGILAPIIDLNETSRITQTWRDLQRDINVWYLGLFYSPGGEIFGTSKTQSDLQQLMTSQLEGSPSSGCIVIDFELGGEWRVVDCMEEHPYLCSQDPEYFERQLGLYTIQDDNLEWESQLIWPGGVVPLDHTPELVITVKEVYMGIDGYLFITMSVIAALGILLALCFLTFNVKFRNQRHVKMSSPNLNNLIILGSVMVYVWVFLYGLDGNLISSYSFQIICQAQNWVISVGFVVAFGAMFSKTWRVHRVASFKTPKRRIVRDNQLYLMVLVLLAIDLLILILWQVIDPMVIKRRMLYQMPDPENNLVRLQPYILYCHSDHLTYWLGAVYCYKGLLLIFGTFLAWETRKVTIAALNDSKLIGISVYNVVILCTIGVGVSFSLGNNPAALFAFVSCIVIFCTSITLIVVFVPKMISVYKHPEGENISAVKTRTNTGPDSMDLSDAKVRKDSMTSDRNQKMEAKIAELEGKLKNKRDIDSIMAGSGYKVCGVWCFGLSCGCSYGNGERKSDKYELKNEVSSTSACDVDGVYTGDKADSDKTSCKVPRAAAEELRNPITGQYLHDKEGQENGGYVFDENETHQSNPPVNLPSSQKTLASPTVITEPSSATPNLQTSSAEKSALSPQNSLVVTASIASSPPNRESESNQQENHRSPTSTNEKVASGATIDPGRGTRND